VIELRQNWNGSFNAVWSLRNVIVEVRACDDPQEVKRWRCLGEFLESSVVTDLRADSDHREHNMHAHSAVLLFFNLNRCESGLLMNKPVKMCLTRREYCISRKCETNTKKVSWWKLIDTSFCSSWALVGVVATVVIVAVVVGVVVDVVVTAAVAVDVVVTVVRVEAVEEDERGSRGPNFSKGWAKTRKRFELAGEKRSREEKKRRKAKKKGGTEEERGKKEEETLLEIKQTPNRWTRSSLGKDRNFCFSKFNNLWSFRLNRANEESLVEESLVPNSVKEGKKGLWIIRGVVW